MACSRSEDHGTNRADGPLHQRVYMRDYVARYPDGLAGIVFVDGSTPMQQENPAFKKEMSKGPPQWMQLLIEPSMRMWGFHGCLGSATRSLRALMRTPPGCRRKIFVTYRRGLRWLKSEAWMRRAAKRFTAGPMARCPF